MPIAFWSTEDLCRRYGRSRSTLLRWQTTKQFPKAIIKGGHGALSRWDPDDVERWEAAQR